MNDYRQVTATFRGPQLLDVFVTGVGLTTALGTGTEETWSGLVEGRSGVGPIEAFDASTLSATQAGEVRDLAVNLIEKQALG